MTHAPADNEEDLEDLHNDPGTDKNFATVGGLDVTGRPTAFRQEEGARYRGLIAAAMERRLKKFLSRFVNVIGGRASETGEVEEEEQAEDGTAQGALVDKHGRIWVHPVSAPGDVGAFVSERYALVGEKSQPALDRLAIGRPTSRPALLATEATTTPLSDGYDDDAMRTIAVEVRRGSSVTIRVRFTGNADDARPILVPELSDGSNEFGLPEFAPMRAMNNAISVGGLTIGGITVPASLQGFGTLVLDPWVADPPGGATIDEIVLSGWKMEATGMLRFACFDAIDDSGVITVVVSQE